MKPILGKQELLPIVIFHYQMENTRTCTLIAFCTIVIKCGMIYLHTSETICHSKALKVFA